VKLEIADIGAETEADARADGNHDLVVAVNAVIPSPPTK